MSRSCVSAEEEERGYALGCRLYALSDLHLEAVERFERLIRRSSASAFISY